MKYSPLAIELLTVASIAPSLSADLSIEHVNVIAMTPSSDVLPDSTVLIRNGRIASTTKRSGTWLTSTLTTDHRILEAMVQPETLRSRPEIRYLDPRLQRMMLQNNPYARDVTPERIAYVQRVIEFNHQLITILAKEGVPIVAGTDALVPGVVPGFSLHDELEALANAGLSNRQVLESATRLPAEWLGTIDDRGVVAAGKRADLLLLEGNPLADIKNTRRITAVIVAGKLYSRSELNARLQARQPEAGVHDVRTLNMARRTRCEQESWQGC